MSSDFNLKILTLNCLCDIFCDCNNFYFFSPYIMYIFGNNIIEGGLCEDTSNRDMVAVQGLY